MLSDVWRNLITLGNAETVTWVEKIIRPVLVYIALLFLLKMFGKRELAQLNPFDLVVLLILSNTVQNAIIGNDTSLLGGLVGALVLLAVNWLVVRYFYYHRQLDAFFEGEPVELIRDGKVIMAACEKERVTEPELLVAIRRQGYADLAQVERAILETSGAISIIPKQPTTEQKIDEMLERLRRLERAFGLSQICVGEQQAYPASEPRAQDTRVDSS